MLWASTDDEELARAIYPWMADLAATGVEVRIHSTAMSFLADSLICSSPRRDPAQLVDVAAGCLPTSIATWLRMGPYERATIYVSILQESAVTRLIDFDVVYQVLVGDPGRQWAPSTEQNSLFSKVATYPLPAELQTHHGLRQCHVWRATTM